MIKKDQPEVTEQDLRPTLCVNKIQKEVDVDVIKNVIITYDLHPKNVQRSKRKNEDPTTMILFKLKNEREEQHAKRYGTEIENSIKTVRVYVNKEKLIIECFNNNKFGNLSNACKNNNSLCPICGTNESKCKE